MSLPVCSEYAGKIDAIRVAVKQRAAGFNNVIRAWIPEMLIAVPLATTRLIRRLKGVNDPPSGLVSTTWAACDSGNSLRLRNTPNVRSFSQLPFL